MAPIHVLHIKDGHRILDRKDIKAPSKVLICFFGHPGILLSDDGTPGPQLFLELYSYTKGPRHRG